MTTSVTRARLTRAAAQRRNDLSLNDQIGLSLRATRMACGLSQRAYAAQQGTSMSHQARLETRPSLIELRRVLAAYAGSSLTLGLREADRPGRPVRPIDARAISDVVTMSRNRAGWSQERFARDIGIGSSTVSRLERQGVGVQLQLVERALTSAGWRIVVAERDSSGVLIELGPHAWADEELIVRVRGGRRRLAGHRVTSHCPFGPHWWWVNVWPLETIEQAPQWTTERHTTALAEAEAVARRTRGAVHAVETETLAG